MKGRNDQNLFSLAIKTFLCLLMVITTNVNASTNEDDDLITKLRQAEPTPNRNTQISSAMDGFKNVMKSACDKKDCGHTGLNGHGEWCGKDHTRKHMKEFLEDFYTTGVISLAGYNYFKEKFEEITKRGDTGSAETKWMRGYNHFSDEMKTRLRSYNRQLAEIGEVSNISWCKNGIQTNPNTWIFSLPNFQYEKNNPSCGGKAGQDCKKHDECCSGYCMGLEVEPTNPDEDVVGTCTQVRTCYQVLELEEKCDIENPYCGRGSCQAENYDPDGTNSCKGAYAQCSSNEECCSDNCQGGKCIVEKKCIRCANAGEVPVMGTFPHNLPCCAGSYYNPDEGKCVPMTPPFVLPSDFQTKVDKSLIEKVVDFLIPSAYAEGEFGEQVGSDVTNNLDEHQLEELEEEAAKCAEKDTEEERAKCGEELYEKRRQMIEQNEEDAGGGDDGVKYTRQDWAKTYQVPGITATERSNFDTCQINSFLDQWLDSGPTERNAEIVLRAFEVALSGPYTRDYQIFTVGNRTMGVNEHLRYFMERIREERINMTKDLHENDKIMFCKCVAMKGLSDTKGTAGTAPTVLTLTSEHFPEGTPQEKIDEANANRQDLWNGSQCQAEREEYNAKMAERKDAEASEIDETASGQPAREFLAEWTEARAAHQQKRMDINIQLEQELEDLLNQYREVDWDANQFIAHADFKKHWGLNKHLGKLDLDANNYAQKEGGYLYKVKLYRWKGWVIAVIIIASIVLAPVAFLALGAIGAVLGAIAAIALLVTGIIMWINDGEYAPKVKHEPLDSWDNWVKDFWRKGLWIQYSYYDNYKSGDQNCWVFGPRFNCLKNFYSFTIDPTIDLETEEGAKYEEWYQAYKGNSLIDLWLPAFYPANDIRFFVEDMGYVQAQNESLERAMLLFSAPDSRSENHGQKIPMGQANAMAGKDAFWKKEMGDFRIKRLYKILEGSRMFELNKAGTNPNGQKHVKWQDEISLSSYNGYFIPDLTKMPMKVNGSTQYVDMLNQQMNAIKDDFVFDPVKIGKYKEAVIKYASCYKLVDCGYDGPEANKDELIGFAGYFQTETDLKHFAHYVFHLHFMWPRLSAKDRIGYPMLGMEAYLDGVLYNFKVLGSLNAGRGLEYAKLSDAYHESLTQAASWFSSGIEAKQGSSTNIEVRAKRRRKFEAVVLAARGPGAFNGGVSGPINTNSEKSKIDAADVSNLPAHIQRFVKTLENDRKRKESYDKHFGNTKRGKIMTERANQFMAKFNSPLATAKSAVASSSGAKAGGSKDATFTIKSDYKRPTRSSKDSSSSYSSSGGYARGGSPGGGSSQSSGAAPSHGLKDTQIEKMLSSAKKDDSLRRVEANDTIFHIVSKAYKRNLDRVLESRESTLQEVADTKVKKQGPGIDNAKKEELKDLLGN